MQEDLPLATHRELCIRVSLLMLCNDDDQSSARRLNHGVCVCVCCVLCV
jgi:hypothetical protein